MEGDSSVRTRCFLAVPQGEGRRGEDRTARFNHGLEIRVQECTRACETVRRTTTECTQDKREEKIFIMLNNVPLTGETPIAMSGTKNK